MLNLCSGPARNATSLTVRLGGILTTDPDPDAVYANVSHVKPHPLFSFLGTKYDVALLRLSRPVTYTDTILPICLPQSNVNLDQFKVCVATGYGSTFYSGLFFTTVLYTISRDVLKTTTHVTGRV